MFPHLTSSISTFAILGLSLISLAAAQQERLKDGREGAFSNLNANPFDEGFKKLAERELERWRVPGVAVAVVDQGRVWAEGYGIAKFPNTPVTPKTLFFGASTTKAFTAAALALLISSGNHPSLVSGWRTPVSEIIRGDFVMKDPYLTEKITIEDILSHRTGLPGHDMSYGGKDGEGRPYSIGDVVRGLRDLDLTGGLRERFQYCNIMYIVASYVIETITGMWLGDFLRERIWKPLGMESTYFSVKDALAAPEPLAQGYIYYEDKFQEVPIMDFAVVSGAGSIISNVLDYAKWLKALLSHSGPLSKEDITALLTPRSFYSPVYDPDPFTGSSTYALGWKVGVYQGYEFFSHAGGMEAFGAEVIFFPALNYGVVGFGNTGGTSNAVEQVLQWQLIDDKLGIPAEKRVDWNKLNTALHNSLQKSLQNATRTLYPHIPSPPLPLSRPLESYTGTYTHPTYHNLTLALCPPHYSPFIPQKLCAKRANATWKLKMDFVHVSGEFFVVDADSLLAPGGVTKQIVPAEFRLTAEGRVGMLGVGLEREMGVEGRIWFVRVEG
ncbi:hypothetical protein HYFRA_00013309 [Hymenoscyphus fraxineus]|uniref:Penicillin-binding protein n=1 Tax=Hymenoscyphus fraxineus TaxID=746836 RepID=A0A9N9PZN5_9HELO|nr:hypothetical protein HYFRA_00013309 [Hymenoscyphus fraxineus]